MDVDILYEDNHLLIVHKPMNIPVQGDHSRDLDLLSILKQDLKLRYQKPGNVYLGLVHRLDRPVSGVITFAKTSKAAARLSRMLQRHEMERKYLAIVRGTPVKQKGELEHFLWKNKQKNIVYVVEPTRKGAKKARLSYEVLGRKAGMSLVSVQLHTGRSHQIRVQLAANGTPIYGDQKYGQTVNQPGQQLALFAHTLSFPHPVRDEVIAVDGIYPETYPWNLWKQPLINKEIG
ncbi:MULTISPECIES: RluA family pseudouridine synthase [unclassified Virgibacillus]|uniref:RluA family pseudouridine synthase n=1 Tax=unclassified Virgibacillus TaxID=2620237 RepID=UPI0024DED2C0|nr:RluA family pseudouridine synthase [Virgibacillus sp. LDC-1]